MASEKLYLRFTLNQRIQHIVLVVVCVILVISGFPLKFPNSWWAPVIVRALGGWEMRSLIHHAAGLTMVFLAVYHLCYGLYIVFVKKTPKKILPVKKDFRDFWQYLKHLFGRGEPPRYDRFSWREKFDYWGAFWGMVIMCGTGLVLMFPFEAMEVIPLAWVQTAMIAHSDEALLAFLAIFIWHLWNVHFTPRKFPMSEVWLTGKMTEKEIIEEHPLEYERLIAEEAKEKLPTE